MQIELVKLAQHPDWKDLLWDIVKQENMDPWNINVEPLVNDYITYVREMKQHNFSLSANVILAASILLRYKSDSWLLKEPEPDEQVMEVPDGIIQAPEIPHLEPIMRETKRRVSLEELIFAIEDIMTKEKKKARKQKAKLERSVDDALMELVKESPEDFERKLKMVYDKVKKNIDKEQLTVFSKLLDQRDDALHVVEHLVPLLHLANESKIAMWQEEMFGEIFINLIDEVDNDAEKTG
ncbi:MAG: segregation/condensation protein A [DPANN group archaeon]|nr:segregation/condensation protein A [DPANN group archaeon]